MNVSVLHNLLRNEINIKSYQFDDLCDKETKRYRDFIRDIVNGSNGTWPVVVQKFTQ